MSGAYRFIQWNSYKIRFDIFLAFGLVLYLLAFVSSSLYWFPNHNFNTILIRAFGSFSFLLLHFILLIGPMARIDPRWLPLLYNRRHLGVTLFVMAAVHGILSLIWFYGGGAISPLSSLFLSNTHYGSLLHFPFELLGFAALIIFLLMALTSHDAWLKFFSASWWKYLHMLVYLAYGLVLMHVVLGLMELEKNPVYVVLFYLGFFLVAGLHLLAAFKEQAVDRSLDDHWCCAGSVEDFKEGRARIVTVKNERVAVFLHNGQFSAVHNVCKHQGGPLGEGRVVDGCITCPWHGFQYRPEDGCAPPPFHEKLATYPLQLKEGKVWVSHEALPEGSFIQPIASSLSAKQDPDDSSSFFIGWSGNKAVKQAKFAKRIGWSILSLALVFSLIFSRFQEQLGSFSIDYGQAVPLEGWLVQKPFPMLRIPDTSVGSNGFKSVLLVDAYKKGASELVAGFLGKKEHVWVRIQGYVSKKIIACGPDSAFQCNVDPELLLENRMGPLLEIEAGVRSLLVKTPIKLWTEPGNNSITPVEIEGEIIDPKCYFGAMNPGFGKTHLSCAVRCIAGGIVPVLHYTQQGQERFALLQVSDAFRANLNHLIGRPVKLSGNRTVYDNWEVLQVKDYH